MTEADSEYPHGEYKVGPGRPPLHTRFKKGQSGNPRGPRRKDLPALLVAALDEPVVVTANGESRRVTKREAVIAQLVDQSAGADLRATKMLLDMPQDIEKRAGRTSPPEPSRLVAADEEVVFTQITAAANSYRDAVRFRNGREVRLQELREGQKVRVLDLSVAEELDLVRLREERAEFTHRR